MNTISEKILRRIINNVPLTILENYFSNYHVLPVYHAVSDKEMPHVKHLYKVKTEQEFITELDFLNKYYNFAGIENIIKGTKKKIVHLTFDDGYRECHDVIMPILLQKGIPATFFINTDYIGNHKMMSRCIISLIYDKILATKDHLKIKKIKEWSKAFPTVRDWLFSFYNQNDEILSKLCDLLDINIKAYLDKRKPYLDSNQIKKIVNNGFTIGSHGKNHTNFRHLTLKEQVDETLQTTDTISTDYKQEFKLFAFPYDDLGVSSLFFEKVKSDIDLTFGTTGFYEDHASCNLQRLWMESGENKNMKDYLSSKYKNKLLRKYIYKNDYMSRP